MAKELNMLNKSLQENLDLTAYSQVGHTHKYAGSDTVGGAASTAVKLHTARKINGTNFDGTGNITTANWGTARNIQIGSTSKSVNGSGNVGWTLAEIGAAPTDHNHTFVESIDTRSTNPNPDTYTKRGLTPEFKSSTTIGLPNVGNGFTGLLTYQQWSDTSDWSGGKTTQFATIDDGRMYYRKGDGSGWGSWYQFYTTQNKPTYSDVGAAAASHGTHVTYATATPSANGTAAVGSSAKVAREDHVHPLQTTISGAAGSAEKWTTARTLTIGNAGKSVDGSANVTWTLSEIGALPLSGGTMTGTITTPNNAQGIKVGDDAVICDRNIANHIVIEGATATSGGITFGSGKDTNIYRGGANLLKTDDTFNAVGGFQWNGQSLDNRYAKASHGSHISFSTATPKVAGTATVGSDSGAARGDHVHPAQTSVSGNAGTATKLQSGKEIAIGNKSNNFDGSANISYSLADIGSTESVVWTASIKCATWSRLFQYKVIDNVTVGGTYLVNIRATRSSVVYNPTLLVNFSHSTKAKIVQLNNTEYSNIKVRCVVDDNGAGYFEIYDNVNSATNSTTQSVYVTVIKLSATLNITKYTAFTSGATVPTNYTAVGEMTTISGTVYSGTAAKATILETTRTINGTNFNGSGNITTANWGTARNLQIGNSSKSVNGSENMSWSLSEIGALPTAGGTMTGNIRFSDVTSTTYPAKSAMLTWNGSTDGADIYYQVDASDKGRLVLNTRDDADCIIAFANKGTFVSTIDNSGNFSGKAATAGNADTATKLATARTITIGNQSQSFDGTGNIAFSVASIGAAASSHSHNTLPVKGTNTITSTTDDTTTKWGAQGTSVHWYTQTGQLIDQPNQWGYLLNVGQGSEVHQLWMTQASGDLKHRGGNDSGWSGTWRTILDTSNYKAHVTPNNIGAAASTHGTHVNYSTAAPLVAGTANVGSASEVARADHVHPAQTSVSGNAGTATKLQTARTITIGNKSNTFDGNANITYTLADIGALATSGGTMSGNITLNNGKGIYGKTGEALKDLEGATVAAGTSGGLLVYNTSHNLHLGALVYDKNLVTGNTYLNGAVNMFVRTNKGYVAMQPERTSTMTFYKTYSNTNVPLRSSVSAGTYLAGNQGTALLNSTASAGAYTTLIKSNSTNGYFTLNSYRQGMLLSYTAKSTVDAGTNAVTKTVKLIDEAGDTSFPGTVAASAFSGNATSATKLQAARNIKIGNATKSFNGTANVEFTLAEIGIGSSISAVASNLSGVTINGYDSILSGINTNIGKL